MARLGGDRLRADVIADHQSGQAQQQPERGRGKQRFLLEESVEEHDDDAKDAELRECSPRRNKSGTKQAAGL